MAGINKVIIVGNLGNHPQTNKTLSGLDVANLSVATSESWTDKKTGEQQEKTEWHRVCVFGNAAKYAKNYLVKGSKVYVEGSLETSKWEKDGQERYTTEIKVAGYAGVLQGLDKKPEDDIPF
tara:strand:- start:77 stop:442 length:366 start_codon:yes stop_codon:yes gene_type:complete